MGISHRSRVGIRDELHRSRILYRSSKMNETMIVDKGGKGSKVYLVLVFNMKGIIAKPGIFGKRRDRAFGDSAFDIAVSSSKKIEYRM